MIKDKKAFIQLLATRYNLSLKKVEEIVNYQFKFVEKVIKKGTFESVRLPYFGKFSAKPNRIKHITKLKNESNRWSITYNW